MPSGASQFGGPVYDARIEPFTDPAQQAFDYEHLEQAIDLHAGEGAAARDRFRGLAAGERAALIAFLKTL